MNIYVIKAHDMRGWDMFEGFVVVAKSGGEARRTAARAAANRQGSWDGTPNETERAFWMDIRSTRCTEIGTYTGRETGPHIVLEDFKRG